MNWWKNRSKKAKTVIVLAAFIAVGVAAGNGSKSKTTANETSGTAVSNASSDTNTVPVASNDGPLVRGSWNGECNPYGGGDQDACRAVKVSNVSCQWQDGHVHMSVEIKNTFAAHVTVHMDPIYKLQNAGLHGDGFTAVQDIGLDAGELRTFATDQEPHGVSTQPAITLCRPGVDTLLGVDLG